MKNEYDLQNIENFKINPHVWLQTLLAIAGDKEKKREVVQTIAEQSGFLSNLYFNINLLDNRTTFMNIENHR